MINGLLLFGSSYRSKYARWICLYLLALYACFKANWKGDIIFQVVNILFLIVIPLIIGAFKKGNKITSVLSILIYSVAIDIFCYFYFAVYNYGENLINYIYQGILFNRKSILIPMIISISMLVVRSLIIHENKAFSTR